MRGRVTALLYDEDGSLAQRLEFSNLITTAGLGHYMDAVSDSIGGGSTPTLVYAAMALGTTAGTPAAPNAANDLGDVGLVAAAGLRNLDSGYPKVNDTDTENTGKGLEVFTYKGTYGPGVYTNTDVSDVAITTTAAVYVGGGGETDNILMHAEFDTIINKTAGQTLVVYVNHSLIDDGV